MLNAKQTEKLFKEFIDSVVLLKDEIAEFNDPMEGLRSVLVKKYRKVNIEMNEKYISIEMTFTPDDSNISCFVAVNVNNVHQHKDDRLYCSIRGFEDGRKYPVVGEAFRKSLKFVAHDGYIEYDAILKKDLTLPIDEKKIKYFLKFLKEITASVRAGADRKLKHDTVLEKLMKDL